jgi:hypothetical protein
VAAVVALGACAESLTSAAADGCAFDMQFRAGWSFGVRRSQAEPPSCTHVAATTLPEDLGWHYAYLRAVIPPERGRRPCPPFAGPLARPNAA